MGQLSVDSWNRMNILVQEHGEEDVLHMICDMVGEGMSLSDVGRTEGINYSVLWRWLSVGDRMAAYRLALEARADKEAHEMLHIADSATEDGVGVAKLRVESRKWLSSKWSRKVYGDGNGVAGGGFGGVTVIIGDVCGRVIEQGTQDRLIEVAEGSSSGQEPL